MVACDKIILKGIRFHGFHGVAEAERQLGQKFEADVELVCDLAAAGGTDDLARTIDYAQVVDIIVKTGTEESFRLIETLAETSASRILNRFPVREVQIAVKKLAPPISEVLRYVAVEIRRGR